MGRMFSDTFAGIAPASALGFVLSQAVGAAAGGRIGPHPHTLNRRCMTITIYHNPGCGTSRNTLALIRNSGTEPQVIEYLKTPPDRKTLLSLIQASGLPVIDVVRTKEKVFAELQLEPRRRDRCAIGRCHAGPPHPHQPPDRGHANGHTSVPPVRTGAGHPAQPQRGAFTKEDGEVVINDKGQRV